MFNDVAWLSISSNCELNLGSRIAGIGASSGLSCSTHCAPSYACSAGASGRPRCPLVLGSLHWSLWFFLGFFFLLCTMVHVEVNDV